MARKKSLSVYILALLLFVGGVGYMAWAGLSENSVYFLNVSEALTMPSQELQAARLFGTVAEGDIARPGNGLGVRFRLRDADQPGLVVWASCPTPSNPARKSSWKAVWGRIPSWPKAS